jgi:hypothetical protein
MNLLSASNSKLKRDGIYAFSIPAYRSESGKLTCPGAKDCINGCYARGGFFLMPSVRKAYERNLQLTQSKDFVGLMVREIKVKQVKIVRIHASGDFYSKGYLASWLKIMVQCPDVKFYAYTKMIPLFRGLGFALPDNFTVIFSEGGKYDAMISDHDRHARVFQTRRDMIAAGYADTTTNDIRAMGKNPKIGLVYHGAKAKAWNTERTG